MYAGNGVLNFTRIAGVLYEIITENIFVSFFLDTVYIFIHQVATKYIHATYIQIINNVIVSLKI